MKKIGEIIVFILSVFTLPSIIQLAIPDFYNAHRNVIWIVTAVITFLLSLTQFDFLMNAKIRKHVRKIRFTLFQTRTIVIILLLQLIIILLFWKIKGQVNFTNSIIFSIAINLGTLNFLIIFKKILSSDLKELLFHEPPTGRVFLYSKNALRWIPDPETFNLFGFIWNDLIDLNTKELDTYEILAPIISVKEMQLIQFRRDIYGLVNDELKRIPNKDTLDYIRNIGNHNGIKVVGNLNGYKVSKPFVDNIW